MTANPPKFPLTKLKQLKTSWWLIIIITIAVLSRLAMSVYIGDSIHHLPGTFDEVSYDMLAQQLLSGNGFTVAEDWWPATRAGEPTAHWSYLYTLFLTAVYAIFGHHPLAVRIIQAILAGILIPLLVYRVGQRYFNSSVGLVAAGLSAVYIYFIYYAAALVTETLYIVTALWTLDLAGKLVDQLKTTNSVQWKDGFLLGLALAITILLRQVFLFFVPILFIWLLWQSYRYRLKSVFQMMVTLAVAVSIVVVSIVPWTIRNYQAFNTFVLLNTNAGFAFYWGNHPIHGYNFISILPEGGPTYFELIPPELLSLNEAELDRALLKRSVEIIQEDPLRYLVLSTSRIRDFFKFWPSPESGIVSNISRVLSFGILLPFMIYGFIRHISHSLLSKGLILYLFILNYSAIHFLSWALIRYRLPIDAILIIFASLTIIEISTAIERRQFKLQDSLGIGSAR
ncbi:MAG: glycosyltransferase family 39 protein [Anaerolineae bacterium]|nr:glycosyltransferase family 39 protein [Anaerolineae bacterium]MCB9107516.1 glycosyltransferase family 39 protein [Anaerolineales bacterium]